MRGSGWVLERITNESAKQAQQESIFNAAFANNSYLTYANENVYLDDDIFVEKMTGNNRYVCTIKSEKAYYCVRYFDDSNVYYVDENVDHDYPIKLVSSKNLHDSDFVLDNNVKNMINCLKVVFEKGLFRFKNLQTKNAVIEMLR